MSQTINSLKSICILRLSSIGDITHMIPIIKTIQTYSVKTNITWIIGKTEYTLVKNMTNIKFIVIDKNSFFHTLLTLLDIYRNCRFDALLHMQVSLRSNLISTFIKAKRKIGFDKHNSKDIHGIFINERIDWSPKLHVMETFFKFPSKLGINKRCYDKDIRIEYMRHKFLPNKKYIVFNPFTSSRKLNYRQWNIKNYKSIIKYLSDNYNIDSVMVGGNSKHELAQSKFLDSEKRLYNLVGKTNLQELYNILKMCELYIGPDSGTLHIASMLDKPIIGLYATSNPDRTGPIGNMEYVINKYSDALKKYNNSEVKSVKWGTRVRNKKAMDLINIKDVTEKIDRILKF